MSRLFSANMMRLRKSKLFIFGEIFMVGYALLVYDSAKSNMESGGPIDNWSLYFFNALLLSGFVTALFVSFFLSAEYSDGTIRNKLMVGHKRKEIYLVNFVTCLLAEFIMYVTYFLSSLLFGFLIFGNESLQVRNAGVGLLCNIFILLVYTAIFVLVEMLDKNKVRSMAVNLMGALLILVIGIVSYSELWGHPDTVGFMWHIIEVLFPSVLVMYVASADSISYFPVILGLFIETVCLVGIGVWGFGRKDIQ